jgi:uncharacterized membrane-anchored protein YhcB (DUF1043 family)
MTTLLKFTIGNALVLLLVAGVLGLLITYFVYYLGNRQAKKDKRLQEAYDRLYRHLIWCVNNFKIDEMGKKLLKEKFDNISKFKCCNKEKLAVLEVEFYRKFK